MFPQKCFITFYSSKYQKRVMTFDAFCHFHGKFTISATCPSSRKAQFNQDLDRFREAMFFCRFSELVHVFVRIGKQVKIEFWILPQFQTEFPQILLTNNLVGHQNFLDSPFPAKSHLVYRCYRDGPGTIFQLPVKKLGSHGRFSMGRNSGTKFLCE